MQISSGTATWDTSDPAWDEHVATTEDLLNRLELERVPRVMVFNKADRLDPGVVAHMAEVRGATYSTATDAAGVQPLIERLERELTELDQRQNGVTRAPGDDT